MTDVERPTESQRPKYRTQVLPVDPSQIGRAVYTDPEKSYLDDWTFELYETEDANNLRRAASQLRHTDSPVAFPTETVYGLGADATRSSAVSAIYEAKQRPADNPLIVHISSISQLRTLLRSGTDRPDTDDAAPDPIPRIYHPLIKRFWPGPLAILLPLPNLSSLAPQVTAGLPTFAARMPSSPLALALIHLADVPVAAPSANASTRPSPTTAAHVLSDLSGRIETILDGGPCDVGVESTVVDGLSSPPAVLRPGGVSLETLRKCPGWEEAVVGYKDSSEQGAPRVPGMKYKHYSPNAKVILVERALDSRLLAKYSGPEMLIGCVTTKTWGNLGFIEAETAARHTHGSNDTIGNGNLLPADRLEPKTDSGSNCSTSVELQSGSLPSPDARFSQVAIMRTPHNELMSAWTVCLGGDTAHIARGLFSALRGLDDKGVEVIFVEGISDREGDAAAAIMNRLRKAADQIER